MSLADLVGDFEKSLRQYIFNNYEKIQFTHSQYSIDKQSEDLYDITVSITGLGTQKLTIGVEDGTLSVSATNDIDNAVDAFPTEILASLASNVVSRWMAQTVEFARLSAAKKLAAAKEARAAERETVATDLAKTQVIVASPEVVPTPIPVSIAVQSNN